MAMKQLLALITFIFLLFFPNYVHSLSIRSSAISTLFKRLDTPNARPLFVKAGKKAVEIGSEYLLAQISSRSKTAVLYSNVRFSYASGLFNMEAYKGTPFSSYNLSIDTVSGLLWLQQGLCGNSRTYMRVSCNDDNYCDKAKNIIFNPVYNNLLTTVGIPSQDTFSFDGFQAGGDNIMYFHKVSLTFGCETEGILTAANVPALAGLNRGTHSLVSMLGNKFCYCLPSLDSTGFISFLYPDISSTTALKYTPILDDYDDLYFLELQSITVDGGRTVGAGALPTAIVTSTLFSYFDQITYQYLSSILNSSMVSHGLQRLGAVTISNIQFEHCYRFSGGDLPTTHNISFTFRGGQAVLELDNVNLLYPVSESVVCFAFLNLGYNAGYNMIGSYQLTNHLVEHDNVKKQVGFAKYDDCSISYQPSAADNNGGSQAHQSAALGNSAVLLHLLAFTFIAIMVFAD